MEFKIIGDQDYDAVIEHLRESFFADEPLNKAVQLCLPGEGHEELEKQCVETMMDGLSIMAVEDGEILGVALNGVLRPGDTKKAVDKLKTVQDEKFRKIFSLLYETTENLDIFSIYPVESMMECRIMSVGAKARGRGLASELMKRSIQMARDNHFKMFKGDATGKFSQKVCEKYGMQTLKEIPYKEYLDPQTGEPVFDVQEPHTGLKIMFLSLEEN